MNKHNKFDSVSTQGHAFFMYGSDDERLKLLADYFREGVEKNELCIFVTPEMPSQVIKQFKTVGFR